MKKTDTLKLLTYLWQAFPQLQPTEARRDVWHDLVGYLDRKAALDAARLIAAEDRDFPPTPGNLIAMANRIATHGLTDTGELNGSVTAAASNNPAIVAARGDVFNPRRPKPTDVAVAIDPARHADQIGRDV